MSDAPPKLLDIGVFENNTRKRKRCRDIVSRLCDPYDRMIHCKTVENRILVILCFSVSLLSA